MNARAGCVAALGALLASLSAAVQAAPGAASDAAASPIVSPQPLFAADDLMLFEVVSHDVTLSDALGGYSSRAGIFLPLGELARLLDLSIVVDPPQRRAEGWFLAEKRRLTLDLSSGHAEVEGRTFTVSASEATLYNSEIYVRLDLLGKLLPIKVAASVSALRIELTTREPFPFEERLERERRRKGLGAASPSGEVLKQIDTPYELVTPPSVDVDLALGAKSDGRGRTEGYQVRLAGDLLYAGMQLFAGSDDQGHLNEARVLLERHDPDGISLGPVRVTRVGTGDVYTPTLTVGAASHGGRGFALTNEPLDQLSVFDHVDLRGELPDGYEVELYVNEVLRASQSVALQGQYQFLQVPLTYGINTVRLVFYGPHGERREQVSRVNVGSGQLTAGQTVASFGVVDQGVAVYDVRRSGLDPSIGNPGYGSTQYSAIVAHGLTSGLTVSAGASQYMPVAGGERHVGDLGLVSSVRTVALRGDLARDDDGGFATSLALAGRVGTGSWLARHWEYRGGFVDELQASALGGPPLLRSDDLHLDLTASFPRAGFVLPVSLHAHRDERADGSNLLIAGAEVSSVTGGVLLSSGLDFQRTAAVTPPAPPQLPGIFDTAPSLPGSPSPAGPGTSSPPPATAIGPITSQLLGNLDAAGPVAHRWQLHTSLQYQLVPDTRITSTAVTADRNLSPQTALHFGLQHSWLSDSTTAVQGGLTWRLAHGDLSVNAAYAAPLRQWQLLLRFSTASLSDPLRGRYRLVRPGAAAGGSLVMRAFVDADGDGHWEPGERALAGVAAETPNGEVKSDSNGLLLAGGAAAAARARVAIRPESVDDPYLLLPATGFEFKPRPGRVAVAELPLRTTGEVLVKLKVRDPQGHERGVSALAVEMVDSNGKITASSRTEYDGTVVVENLPPGRYQLRLEPSQSTRLKLNLAAPVAVVIPPAGGYAGEVSATVLVAH